LRRRRKVVIIVPAFNLLLPEFDNDVDRIRRYRQKLPISINPTGFEVAKLVYLEGVEIRENELNKLNWKAGRLSQLHFKIRGA